MAKELYHILKDGIPSEVLTKKELIEKVKNNILNKDTLIWCSKWNDNGNSQEWKKIGEVFEVEKEVNKKNITYITSDIIKTFVKKFLQTRKIRLLTSILLLSAIFLCYHHIKIKFAIRYCQNNFTSNSSSKKLFKNCLIAAKANDDISYYNLGILYMNGLSVKKNSNQAYTWLKKASDNGNNDATFFITYYFGPDKFSVKDTFYENYLTNNFPLTKINDLDSLSSFKDCYNEHWKYNLFQKIKLAANNGDPKSQFDLANLYYHGDLCPVLIRIIGKPNKDEAFKWFEKAARLGLKEAQFNLGMMYYDTGFIKGYYYIRYNLERAVFWIKKAAAQGLKEAQNMMGVLYGDFEFLFIHDESYDDENELTGLSLIRGYDKEDKKSPPELQIKATEYFQEAAKAGSREAQFNLALQYYQGKGIKQNFLESAKWFNEANRPHSPFEDYSNTYIPISIAGNNLGLQYYEGLGVKKDSIKAIKLLGVFGKGIAYDLGKELPQNFKLAFILMKNATEGNYITITENLRQNAKCLLGGMYFFGHGTNQDLIQASKWLKSAMEDNCPQAKKILTDYQNIFGELENS